MLFNAYCLHKPLLKQRTNISPETVTASQLEKQVDELFETFNDIKKMLGKEDVEKKTENISKLTKIVDFKKVCVIYVA